MGENTKVVESGGKCLLRVAICLSCPVKYRALEESRRGRS